MKLKLLFCCLLIVIILKQAECQENSLNRTSAAIDYVQALKDTLVIISDRSDNVFFKKHCNSILAVINAQYELTSKDSIFLKNTYNAFNDQSDPSNAKNLSTYLDRQRPFILSWVSPTDGSVSFSWLNPPINWDPGKKYPLYIQLHGLWSVASNTVEYMTYPYLSSASNSTSFEDGYLLSPWGRGNLWYKDIAETDIWESMAALEKIVQVDPARKYISGHSMGGYGAMSIASHSANSWAALGVYAGALWYYPDMVNKDVAEALKDLPVYFVCGTRDDLLETNRAACQLLRDADNFIVQFVTFSGGHEYLEENVRNMYLWMRQYVNWHVTTGTDQTGETSPSRFAIRCYPNPVTSTVDIVFSGPENSIVNISLYDVYGRHIGEIADGMRIYGENSVSYNVTGLKPGIYIIRMKAGNMVSDSKMILTR